jgi:hypothetical protein
MLCSQLRNEAGHIVIQSLGKFEQFEITTSEKDTADIIWINDLF